MRQTVANQKQTLSPEQIVSVEEYTALQTSKISSKHAVAGHINGIGIMDITESFVPNPAWSKTLHTLPVYIRHAIDSDSWRSGWETSREWVAFQGNLTQDDIAALPDSKYAWHNYFTRSNSEVTDAQRAATEKVTSLNEGSIWLPEDGIKVAISTERELPSSLSFCSVRAQGVYISTSYDVPEPLAREKYGLGGYGSYGSYIQFEGTEDKDGNLTDARLVDGMINPAALIKNILEESWDVSDLWYGHGDQGLYNVALDMARTATRIMEGTATGQDLEDLLIQAGTALDLLQVQNTRLSREREQQKVIDGDLTALQQLGSQALQAEHKG